MPEQFQPSFSTGASKTKGDMQAESSNFCQIRRNRATNDIIWPWSTCTSKKHKFEFDPWSLCFALLRDIKSLTSKLHPTSTLSIPETEPFSCWRSQPMYSLQRRLSWRQPGQRSASTVFTLCSGDRRIFSGPSKFRPWRRSDPQTAEYSLLPGDSTWCSITECLNHWRQERLCHSAVAGIAIHALS